MARILGVRTSVKEDRTLGIFTVEDRKDPIFLTAPQIKSACGLNNNFHLLKGGDLDVEFYKTGEQLISGAECTKDDSIVKSFELTMPESMTKLAMAASVGFSSISL